MNVSERTLPWCIGRGAMAGAAVWSAYAVMEFLFSSVAFAATRPYAEFAGWHWQLTILIVAAYVATGAAIGAVLGALASALHLRAVEDFIYPAATCTLVLAFLLNLFRLNGSGRILLVLLCLAFLTLLAARMRSPEMAERFEFLTNPWLISAILLAVGQAIVLQGMATARQFGVGIQTIVFGIFAVLAAAAAGSVFGRRLLRQVRIPASAATGLALAIIGMSAALASSSTSTPATVSAAASSRPNVLLLVMDTTRADHLSVFGYNRETTPNLEKLAADSVIYPTAFAASDITLTSHASLFTGMYPSWHGAYCQAPQATYGRPLSKNVSTLAELLAAQGYSTLGVSANVYLRTEFGLQRGFQSFDIPRPVPLIPVEDWYLLRGGMRKVLSAGFETAQFDRLFARSEDVRRRFFTLLSRRQSGAPFFAFLNFMDAHFPYVPPAPYNRAFPGKDPRLTQESLSLTKYQISRGAPVPPSFVSHALSQYDGGIRYMDAQTGEILGWLKHNGLYDNTMIIVTADHGEAFGERNHTGHANSPYQTLLHVGLMIKYPHSAHKGTVAQPVSLIDVAPTILQTLGFQPPAAMQGRNIADPAAIGSRELYAETFPCPELQSPECPNGCTARAVFSWPFKFITFSNGNRLLFNIQKDSTETTDLYRSEGEVKDRLSADLVQWTKSRPPQTLQQLQVNEQALKVLKSLGYVAQ